MTQVGQRGLPGGSLWRMPVQETWVDPWSRKIPTAMEQLSPNATGSTHICASLLGILHSEDGIQIHLSGNGR